MLNKSYNIRVVERALKNWSNANNLGAVGIVFPEFYILLPVYKLIDELYHLYRRVKSAFIKVIKFYRQELIKILPHYKHIILKYGRT